MQNRLYESSIAANLTRLNAGIAAPVIVGVGRAEAAGGIDRFLRNAN